MRVPASEGLSEILSERPGGSGEIVSNSETLVMACIGDIPNALIVGQHCGAEISPYISVTHILTQTRDSMVHSYDITPLPRKTPAASLMLPPPCLFFLVLVPGSLSENLAPDE